MKPIVKDIPANMINQLQLLKEESSQMFEPIETPDRVLNEINKV